MTPRSSAARADEPIIDIQPELAQGLGRELETQTKALALKLANVKVDTVADCQQAVVDRQDIGARVRAVQQFFEPFKQMAHKLHKALCEREKEILTPLQTLDGQLRDGIQTFDREQERQRREAEDLERQRQQKEQQDRAAAEAAALEQAGDTELAKAVLEEAIAAPVPVVVLPSVRQQVEGLKMRTEWRYRVTRVDLVPREYLALDEKKVGAYVRAMKGTGRIPGIEIYSEQVPVR